MGRKPKCTVEEKISAVEDYLNARILPDYTKSLPFKACDIITTSNPKSLSNRSFAI